MKGYKHLSLEERELLFSMYEQHIPFRLIAKRLQRSHATLSREIRKNKAAFGSYIPWLAQKAAWEAKQEQRSRSRLKNIRIYTYVTEHLKCYWSPEEIAGRLPIDYPGFSIHFETIYRFIYADGARELKLWQYLTHARFRRMSKGGRRVKRMGKIPGAVSIEERPVAVALREVIGHWETDNVIGSVWDTGALSTTTERVSLYTMLTKLAGKTAQAKYGALVARLGALPHSVRLSLTADNGMENAKHKRITKTLKMPVYFCHSYASWEKGTVENTNGRIRRFLPKGRSIDAVSVEEIQEIEYLLNHTPRKRLGFLMPAEVLALTMQRDTGSQIPATIFS